MKKLVFVLISIFICISTYAQEFTLDGFRYGINGDNNTVTLKGHVNLPPVKLVIPDKVTFKDKEYNVTVIGEKAFFDCSEISSVKFSNKVFKVEFGAFSYCKNLTNITFEEGIGVIERLSFNDCPNLKSVYISKTVKLIGEGAFMKCNNLQIIEVDPENKYFSSFKGALYDKSYSTLLQYPGGLGLVNISNLTNKIGDAAFWGNTNIVAIDIPRNIRAIGGLAFKNCTRLTTVIFPATIYDASSSAFEGCVGLKEIICKDMFPNTNLRAYSIFENETLMFAKLIVPIGALQRYKASRFWGQFENIEESELEGTVSNECIRMYHSGILIETTHNGVWITSENGDTLVVYSINGAFMKRVKLKSKQFVSLNPGIYIIVTANFREKVII